MSVSFLLIWLPFKCLSSNDRIINEMIYIVIDMLSALMIIPNQRSYSGRTHCSCQASGAATILRDSANGKKVNGKADSNKIRNSENCSFTLLTSGQQLWMEMWLHRMSCDKKAFIHSMPFIWKCASRNKTSEYEIVLNGLAFSEWHSAYSFVCFALHFHDECEKLNYKKKIILAMPKALTDLM